MTNPTTRTPEKDAAILGALREKGKVTSACRQARVPRRTYYQWREDDPTFRAASDRARQEGLFALLDQTEDALIDRGSKNDTTAAIFMLKSHRRQTYGDKIDHTHRGMITFDPEWIAIRSAILEVLAPHPEILNQLVGRLAALEAGDAPDQS